MIRPDTTKYRLLEMIGMCGEFPADQLNRLIPSASYAEKLITDLKAEHLIRTHYRDALRGYRDLFSYEDTQTTHPEKDTNQTLLLEHLTQLGTGQSSTIQKGIVALYLQQQGYTSFDLAKHYQVPANRVRAWQSKARKLLQQDDALYALLT